MGFTAKAKLTTVLLDPKPLAAFLALANGITVVPLALQQASHVFHGAFHRLSVMRSSNSRPRIVLGRLRHVVVVQLGKRRDLPAPNRLNRLRIKARLVWPVPGGTTENVQRRISKKAGRSALGASFNAHF